MEKPQPARQTLVAVARAPAYAGGSVGCCYMPSSSHVLFTEREFGDYTEHTERDFDKPCADRLRALQGEQETL